MAIMFSSKGTEKYQSEVFVATMTQTAEIGIFQRGEAAVQRWNSSPKGEKVHICKELAFSETTPGVWVEFWAPHFELDIDRSEWVQRKATKMTEGFQDLSYEDQQNERQVKNHQGKMPGTLLLLVLY